MNPQQSPKLCFPFLQCFMSEYSAPILDEQIVEECIRTNPELYALGRDFANSVTNAWNRLRTIIKRMAIRRVGHAKLEWQSPIFSRCGTNFSPCSLSGTQSFYSGQYSFSSDQTSYPIQFHQYVRHRETIH